MAQLAKTPCPGDWEIGGEDWDNRHTEQFKALEVEAAKVDPAVSLVGAIVSFPWADSSALYRVSKDKPLTLQHIPVFDAWQVRYSQIRGLRRADVVSMVEGAQRMRELFA